MDNKVISSRLRFFPIMLFAIVMGFSGLAIVFQKASEMFGVPPEIGVALSYIDVGLFVVIALFYTAKIIKYPSEVGKEFAHPIRVNFFAAVSISLLLLSIVFHDGSYIFAKVLFLSGLILHTFFTFYTVSFWINNNLEIQHSNPAWFIPIVGNIIVPVAGVGMVSNDLLMFYFSVGLFFWVVLFTMIFYRIIFHHQLAQKFIPTLFILIAPPAVGFIAYIKLGYEFDIFAKFLLDLGLFFTFLVLFMFKNFMKLKFFISWWAFTFPLAAITIATILAYHVSGSSLYEYLSYALIAVTSVVVFIVGLRTIEHIFKKEICIEE